MPSGTFAIPNLVNDFFGRRFQVIQGIIEGFMVWLALPKHTTNIQGADEGFGILVLSDLESSRRTL